MSNQMEYFAQNRYQHQYNLGDRVRGRYQGVPFAGTVLIDNFLTEDEGPFVVVDLDLPIKVDGQVMNMIKVTHKDLHGPEEKYEFSRKANKKK